MRGLSDKKELKKYKNTKLFNKKTNSFIGKLSIYLVLCGIGFVFLYPILVIISASAKDSYDLVNPLVHWVPTKITFENYQRAFKVLGGWDTVTTTIFYMGIIALAQTIMSAVIAYGFAKYDFWCKRFIFALMIATFILPAQVTFLPKYVLFNNLNLTGTIFSFLIPSIFGQGLKNALFILIFFQFFKMTPKALDEAAAIDGAGDFRIFAKINMVMATPAIIIVYIFSFVWNWNETYLADSYFGNKILTLPLALERFKQHFETMFPSAQTANPLLKMNEGVMMAGTLLTLIPLILLYILIERKLVESIDSSGITGE